MARPRHEGAERAPGNCGNPGYLGNDSSRKRYVERFRATEWIASYELRNRLKLSAVLCVRCAVPIAFGNEAEGIARRTEETFDPYLSLRFRDKQTLVFPHRSAHLRRKAGRRGNVAYQPHRHASDRCGSNARRNQAKKANSQDGEFGRNQRGNRAFGIGNAFIAAEYDEPGHSPWSRARCLNT